MKQAVIFDFDGVLADSTYAITTCIAEVLAARDVATPEPAELTACVGPPLATSFARFLDASADSTAVGECVDDYRSRYATASLERTQLYPGINQQLTELSGEYVLAVATSKPARFTRPLLEKFGLARLFGCIATPALDALAEPKEVTVRSALVALSHPSAVMVGDRSFDVQGARANNLCTIGVTWGAGTRGELEAANAAAIIDDPAELSTTVMAILAPARGAN